MAVEPITGWREEPSKPMPHVAYTQSRRLRRTPLWVSLLMVTSRPWLPLRSS